jgi:Putative prokaryotic signal transducing protein
VNPTAPSQYGDWTVILEASQIYEAELAALRLREAGLEARVIDQSYRQEPVPSVRALAVVRVLVATDRAEEARRILAEGTELAEGAELSAGTEETGGDEG